MFSALKAILFGSTPAPDDYITVFHAGKCKDWEIDMDTIVSVFRDEKTDLCVVETLAEYIYCYETVEEVMEQVIELGGIRCKL